MARLRARFRTLALSHLARAPWVYEDVLEFTFEARPRELHDARQAVSAALGSRGIDPGHTTEVVAVVNELIAAVRECDVRTPVVLRVTPYPLLTSVRLRCDRRVELRDKPFDLRELLIQRLVIGFGRRRRDDGSVDLWAEIPSRH
jgi:hypothetical protein